MAEQQVRIFTSTDGQAQLEVALERDTVWLNQAQMAELFGKDVRTINEHVGNVFGEGEGVAVARVISDYARSWSLLQGYVEQQLAEVGTQQPDMHPLGLDEALKAIGELKQTLIAKGEATELFGQ